jgi:acetyltransferase-like isoleucine patch superfamily enzyme
MPFKNVRIYKNVRIGKNANIDEYVIIGNPPRGKKHGEMGTIIGNNAVIRSHTVIYAGVRIGDNLETGHGAMIRENCTIGDNVSIGTHTIIENNNTIGDNVRVHSGVFIPQYTTIENDVWIGPNVVFTNDPHPPCAKCVRGPTLKRGSKIGAHATILPFVVVGEEALVGAGALVVDDVPPASVVAGFPAKVIKKIGELKCRFGIVEKPYDY